MSDEKQTPIYNDFIPWNNLIFTWLINKLFNYFPVQKTHTESRHCWSNNGQSNEFFSQIKSLTETECPLL